VIHFLNGEVYFIRLHRLFPEFFITRKTFTKLDGAKAPSTMVSLLCYELFTLQELIDSSLTGKGGKPAFNETRALALTTFIQSRKRGCGQ